MKKRIFIYGDSLTWGKDPESTNRLENRYTEILKKNLGDNYEVIDEGLRGRMVKGESPSAEDKNGYTQFIPILSSHLPVDILIIFLGTNEFNTNSNKDNSQIVLELKEYLDLTSKACVQMNFNNPTKTVFIAPPIINDAYLRQDSKFKGAQKRMLSFACELREMTIENNCLFFDTNEYIAVSEEDGVHIDNENNKVLAEKLSTYLKSI